MRKNISKIGKQGEEGRLSPRDTPGSETHSLTPRDPSRLRHRRELAFQHLLERRRAARVGLGEVVEPVVDLLRFVERGQYVHRHLGGE